MRKSRGSSPSRKGSGQGVVSFTLMGTAKTMEAKDLMSVTPEVLAQAILRRRNEASKHLPKELEQRNEENDRAYAVFLEAKQRLETISTSGPSGDEQKAAQIELEEKEAFRRRTVSRLWVVKNAIKDNDEAIEFWSSMVDSNWGHLLEDAERVKAGEPSSYTRKTGQSGEVSE